MRSTTRFPKLAVMLITGKGMAGPLPAELSIAVVACAVAMLALRPCKAGWLAFLYAVGGVEVSARTRAHLRWARPRREGADARVVAAEGRARRAGAPR